MPLPQTDQRQTTALDRTTCVLGLALGIAGFAFIGIEYASVLPQMAGNPRWWLVPALIVVPGMYGAMIVTALLRSGHAVRRLCACFPVCYLPVVLTIPLVFDYKQLPPMHFPWPLLVGSGTIITASFVIGMRGVLLLALFYAGVHAVAVYWCQFDVSYGWAIREGVSIAMIGVIFGAVIRSVAHNARTIDEESQKLREVAWARARATAIGQERDRVDALVHDTVMSTFVAANNRAPLVSVRASAAHSLAALDQLEHDDIGDRTVFGPELVARLRQVVTDAGDDVLTVEHDHSDGTSFPVEVARMFQEVIAEAARNSVRHAGPTARRALRVSLFPDSIWATLADNGVGFDPDHIPPLRLGINTGMRARVSHVPGATISIESAVGRGTTITVRWQHRG